jgi:hypothetical protein
MPICKFRNISERDMDLLFMEAFATDPCFVRLFLEQTSHLGKPFEVVHIEQSKMESGLGETGITVICNIDGEKYVLLIEDKIDAIAMPEQHDRYVKRGQKGVANNEYAGFDVFIVCPERYRNTNAEAMKYEHFVSYEKCREYFSRRTDALYSLQE